MQWSIRVYSEDWGDPAFILHTTGLLQAHVPSWPPLVERPQNCACLPSWGFSPLPVVMGFIAEWTHPSREIQLQVWTKQWLKKNKIRKLPHLSELGLLKDPNHLCLPFLSQTLLPIPSVFVIQLFFSCNFFTIFLDSKLMALGYRIKSLWKFSPHSLLPIAFLY